MFNAWVYKKLEFKEIENIYNAWLRILYITNIRNDLLFFSEYRIELLPIAAQTSKLFSNLLSIGITAIHSLLLRSTLTAILFILLDVENTLFRILMIYFYYHYIEIPNQKRSKYSLVLKLITISLQHYSYIYVNYNNFLRGYT